MEDVFFRRVAIKEREELCVSAEFVPNLEEEGMLVEFRTVQR